MVLIEKIKKESAFSMALLQLMPHIQRIDCLTVRNYRISVSMNFSTPTHLHQADPTRETSTFKLFQHGEFVFTFSESLCYVLLFLCANKNFRFWRLSNDCQIVRPALVSYGPSAKHAGHKLMEKNSVRNLLYGPKTRLIRGIYDHPKKSLHWHLRAIMALDDSR